MLSKFVVQIKFELSKDRASGFICSVKGYSLGALKKKFRANFKTRNYAPSPEGLSFVGCEIYLFRIDPTWPDSIQGHGYRFRHFFFNVLIWYATQAQNYRSNPLQPTSSVLSFGAFLSFSIWLLLNWFHLFGRINIDMSSDDTRVERRSLSDVSLDSFVTHTERVFKQSN